MSLLKVDVERAELAVLRGLTPGDWAAVEQVAMEAHGDASSNSSSPGTHEASSGGSSSGGAGAAETPGGSGVSSGGGGGRLDEVRALLADAGFARVVVEQDVALAGTRLFNVYALRGEGVP